MDNYPKQYQQGYTEFFKLKFTVTPDVLIPRPETETLIESVLTYISSHYSLSSPLSIIDIGTGSGCIAISLANQLATWKVDTQILATDISGKTLKVAQENALTILKSYPRGVTIRFLKSDLLSSVPRSLLTAPLLIVANLPYIPSSRIAKLDPSVKDFEPLIALDGGKDGFDMYRKLFAQICKNSLPPGRWDPKLIAIEIDDTQSKIAQAEAKKYFPEAQIEVKKDLFKRPRVLLIKDTSEAP